MLRMDAIFLCFIFTTLEEGSNLSHAALWAALRSAASVGNERDGEDARPWANCCLGLRNPANYQAINVNFFRAFVEMIRDETVGIHCGRNKPEIPTCALFHNTERRSCYYNDLSKPVMDRMWPGISHCGTLNAVSRRFCVSS